MIFQGISDFDQLFLSIFIIAEIEIDLDIFVIFELGVLEEF